MVLVRCLVRGGSARAVVVRDWKNVHSSFIIVSRSVEAVERATDGRGKRVLLGVVERLDVAADLLHHGLALPGLPLDLVDAAEQLLDTGPSPAEGQAREWRV